MRIEVKQWVPPVRVANDPAEPVPALLVRFAHVNGWIGLRHFCKLLGSTPEKMGNGADLATLATATRIAAGELQSKIPVFTGKSVTYFGHRLSAEWLDTRRRRICPSCLAEDGRNHQFWWGLKFIDRCPDHGIALSSRCACGKVLTYTDADNLKCSTCTDEGLLHEPAKVDVPPRPFQGWCLAKMGCGAAVDPVPALDNLPLMLAIQLVAAVASLLEGGFSRNRPALSAMKDGGIGAAERAFQLFVHEDLQHAIEPVVTGFKRGRACVVEIAPIEALGWFSDEYAFKFAGNVPDFDQLLRSALELSLGFPVAALDRCEHLSLRRLARKVRAPLEAVILALKESETFDQCRPVGGDYAVPTSVATGIKVQWFNGRTAQL